MFQGEAKHWWEIMKNGADDAIGQEVKLEVPGRQVTEKYIPETTWDKLAFLNFENRSKDR